MTKYEQFEQIAADKEITVTDYPFESDRIKGLYCDQTIALSNRLISCREKIGVLVEEIAHHDLNVGDIIDQNDTWNRKQEHQARMRAYDDLVGLTGIISAFNHGCRNLYEMADYLGISESFLEKALEAYRMRYGTGITVSSYYLSFEPYLNIVMMWS